MCPPGARWREANAYAAVISGGRSALAFELLRRDAAYAADAAKAGSGAASASASPAAPQAFTRRWGLHFR
jgi:hypothetical protein